MFQLRQRERRALRVVVALGIVVGCAPVRVQRKLVPASLRSKAVPVSGLVTKTGLERLEAEVMANPRPQQMLELAALHAKLARHSGPHDSASSLQHHRDAAVFSYFAMADPALAEPAKALHAEGVAGCVRISRAGLGSRPSTGEWASRLRQQGIEPAATLIGLRPERVDDLLVAGDLNVSGMNHQFARDGFGCPLVAYRQIARKLDVQDEFYPNEINLAATGVLVPEGSPAGGEWRKHRVKLVLHDPTQESTVVIGGQSWPLSADFTSSLAREQATKARDLARLAWLGLVNPQRAADAAGLFMLTPYCPGKIPIVMIHGLGSGPESWTQIANDVQGDPVLRDHYQIWLIRYATGNPLVLSAAELRKELQRAREAFDPLRNDPAFDRMVVIGHSLGGLMTKALVVESGESLWNARFTMPLWAINASPQLRALLTDVYTIRPRPEIRRVVFIATPHQGSRIANLGIFQLLSDLLIRPTDVLGGAKNELIALNGSGIVNRERNGIGLNVVDSLTFGNPVIEALSKKPVAPGIASHSIIANVRSRAPRERWTDLVVTYESAHHADVESEHIVSSNHLCLEKIPTADEVRRILYLHLNQTITTQ